MPQLNAGALRSALQPLVGRCNVEWSKPATSGPPLAAGVAEFGLHRIAMLAIEAPTKEEVLARTVAISPMPEELRRAMMSHRATLRLLYVGHSEEPLEQLTALYQVAGAFVEAGALGILNERAALAQPTELVSRYLPQLGGPVPPVDLWIGVVTFLHGEEGSPRRFLMRTYGMEQFALPELALYMRDQSEADDAYHTLMNVCLYIIESGPGVQITSGHNAEFRQHTYLFSDPGPNEPELAAPNGLLILIEV